MQSNIQAPKGFPYKKNELKVTIVHLSKLYEHQRTKNLAATQKLI